MTSYQILAKDVIAASDVVLMVLDARDALGTTNDYLLNLVGEKKFLYVINKIDLVPEDMWKSLRRKIKPSIAISSTKHLGTMMLLRKINEIAHGEEVRVGVIGYPNTGKSSLINALRNRASTSVSPVAGHTKAIQFVRVSQHVLLIDCPGVLPRDDLKDDDKRLSHEILGTVDVHKIKDPDMAVFKLFEEHAAALQRYYGVENADAEDFIEQVALKKKIVSAGGKADISRMARQILRDYQAGKFIE